MTEENSTVERLAFDSDGAMLRKGNTYTLDKSQDSLAIFATEIFADKINESVKKEETETGLPVKAIVVDDLGDVYAFTEAAILELGPPKDSDVGRFGALLSLPLHAFRASDKPRVFILNRRACEYGALPSGFFYQHDIPTHVIREVLSAIPKEFHLELFRTALFRRPSWENADFDSDSKTLRNRHIITVVSVNAPNPWGRIFAVFNYADFITKKEVSVRFN